MKKLAWLGILSACVLSASSLLAGCIGGCGVGPVDGPNSSQGVVTFDDVEVGSSESLAVPFQDSANVDETILSASITGPDADAFEVVSTFPVDVPAGRSVALEIRFTPTHAGAATATLTLETAGMGPSPVTLDGTGEETGR